MHGGCKMGIEDKLFVTLFFVKNNCNYTVVESTFGTACSNCQEQIIKSLNILRHIYRAHFAQLWPTRNERDILQTFLPECFKYLAVKPVAAFDISTLTCYDSLFRPTRQLHWDDHKGFGPHWLQVVDLLGNPLGIQKFLFNGNGSELAQYRMSDLFLQQNGMRLDDDETLLGDKAFTGRVKFDGPAEFVKTFTPQQIAAATAIDPQLGRDCVNWNKSLKISKNPVECVIGGSKNKSQVQGNSMKTRVSAHSHFDHIELMCEVAQYIHMSTMRMRDQQHQSNPAVLSHRLCGVDIVEKSLNQTLYLNKLFTSRKNMYFGGMLAGAGTQAPPVNPNM